MIEVPFSYRSDQEIERLNSVYSIDEINAMESYIAVHQMTPLAKYCSDFNYEYKNMMSDLDTIFSLQIKELAKKGKQLFDSGGALYVNGEQHMILNGNISYGSGKTVVKYTKWLLDNNYKNFKLELNKLSDGKIHLECLKLKILIGT